MNNYSLWLTTALEAAESASALLRSEWRNTHTVHWKGFRDVVTEMDMRCEALILDYLHGAFPDHAVTSEEAGAEERDAQVRWFIDPIDGTTNFSRNNPNFSVSIAAVEKNVPVVGVIADPLRGHIFAAYRGGGATMNGHPLHVSDVTNMPAAVFAVDSPRDPAMRKKLWHYLGALLHYGRTMRATGSAALNMAHVAAGWIDIYLHTQLSPWDQAAGGLLVLEAGGVLSTISGEPWSLFCEDPLMAASPSLIQAFYELMSELDI